MQANAAPRSRPAAGFTLIELLTVIAIIGVLASLLIVVVGKVRSSARQAQSVSNLRQIALMFPGYAADNRGYYPWYDLGGTPPAGAPTIWYEFLKQHSGKANYESVYACAEWKARVTSAPGNSMGFGINTTIRINGVAKGAGLGTYQSGGTIVTNTGSVRLRINTVPEPSRTILLGSAGFIVGNGGGRATWNLDLSNSMTLEQWIDPNRGGTRCGALRHGGKAAYAFYDASVSVLQPDAAFQILTTR
jgi:prepilin-type N-terminal cleavage/methylation domain-containing protein/prepilin-type processing-associated H-X9-DG protein